MSIHWNKLAIQLTYGMFRDVGIRMFVFYIFIYTVDLAIGESHQLVDGLTSKAEIGRAHV